MHNTDSIKGYAAIGRELLQQVDGPIDAFCAGVGTAGMLMGVSQALREVQSRYAALLVSLHFTGLYETYGLRRASSEEGQAMRDFLAREDTFQQQVLVSLRDDPTYAPYATPEIVARNRHLLRAWDALSLALCFGLEPRKLFSHVPTISGETTLTVTRVEDDPTRGTVDPWPFHQEAVALRCEGRRLPETFADEGAMRVALTHAPWVTLTMQLVRS